MALLLGVAAGAGIAYMGRELLKDWAKRRRLGAWARAGERWPSRLELELQRLQNERALRDRAAFEATSRELAKLGPEWSVSELTQEWAAGDPRDAA